MTEFRALPEQPVPVDIKMFDGVFVKSTTIKHAGSYVPQHSHAYDHLSVIASGAVRLWQDGELLGDFVAPAGIVIEAGCKHLFRTLRNDTTILCVHNVSRTGEIEIEEEHQIVEHT